MEQPSFDFGTEFFLELDPQELKAQTEEVHRTMDDLLTPQTLSPELLQLELNL